MRDRIRYVGLDVHKEAIVVAIAEDGVRGAVQEYGRVPKTATALDRLMRKLADGGARLRFCYEEYGRVPKTATALDRLMRKLADGGARLRFCYEDGVIPARRFRFR